jgi:hypothetical protein
VQRGALAGIVVVIALAAGCSGSAGQPDEVGAGCNVGPRTVCTNQDLRSVSLVAADLRGADFSGSKLNDSDFTESDLRGAKFVGSELSGATFASADMGGADLSKSTVYFTNFTDADMKGVNRTAWNDCYSVQPDGSLSACPNPAASTATTKPAAKPNVAPPSIVYFRLEPPGKCIYDAEGTGIEIQWSAQNATSVVFAIDGIRVDSRTKPRGSTRLPFICNGKPHTATMQAFGAVTPSATATITKSLDETAPLPPVDG